MKFGNELKILQDLKHELARQTYQLGKDSRDWKIEFAQKDLKESGLNKNHLTRILYRPFDIRYTYYTGKSSGFYMTRKRSIMCHMLNENIAICVGRQIQLLVQLIMILFLLRRILLDLQFISKWWGISISHFISYPETDKKDLFSEHETGEKKPNIKSELFEELKKNFKKEVTPEEIFYYIYAVLYSNTYRTKYAEFLKIDFPRVPFTKDYKLFIQLGKLGNQLADLHLLKSKELDKTISKFQSKETTKLKNHASTRTHRERLTNGKVWINKEQYFDGITEEVWQYQIGGYQVCEKWLKDRKGRTLTLDEIKTYCKIVTALSKTIEIQNEIDKHFEEIEKTV